MPPSSHEDLDAHDIRCACGALVARRVEGGIEIRCRRCRRAVLVTEADLSGRGAEVQLCPRERAGS